MEWYTRLDQIIADYFPDLKMAYDEPMSHHTSFRIGGPAKRMAFPENPEQVVLLLNFARDCGAKPLVIGRGTNLLVNDTGLDRLVVNMSTGLNRIKVGEEACTIVAEAGTSLAALAVFACEQNLTGLEFVHGIPGTVGGGVCMNAGAYDGEMRNVVEQVTVLFPELGVKTLGRDEMDFSYRHSLLSDRPDAVVLSAVFRLKSGDREVIQEKMRQLMNRRKTSQPLEYPSAGSTFKRPTGYFAGTLIDKTGLKGLTVGGAQVSEKHAGFVINKENATCADVLALIAQVQERVLEQHGVRLEPEVKIIES